MVRRAERFERGAGRHRGETRRRRAAVVRRRRRACSLPDTLALGWLANREREKRHGARTYYNFNIRLEATNVCVASCLFCSFARLRPGDPGSYTMSLEQAWDKLRQRAGQPLTEVHVVNGLHPDLPFSYYTDMLRGFKRIRPEIHLKCFTAVEIAFFAGSLRQDGRAGPARAAGGRAWIRCRRRREIFAERVRKKICDDKCGADRLPVDPPAGAPARHAHQRHDALRHIETIEERVDHMLRRARCRTTPAGLQAFIPLAFHPDNNQMRKLPAPSAVETLRVHAVSRLMLDNVPHIKAFWIATGVETAQLALWFGADDLDGTVQEEHIYHMAGSTTPEGMTTEAIRRSSERRPRALRARHAVQRDHRPGRGLQRAGGAALRSGSEWTSSCSTQVEKQSIGERQPLPERYLRLSDDEMDARIAAAKRTLGERSSSSGITTSATR
jgi:aminodeoxyfutalosine synthase